MKHPMTWLAVTLAAAFAGAALGAEPDPAAQADEVPEHFGAVVAIAAGAILLGSLAQYWIDRLLAATVATGVSAGAAWLLTGQIEVVGIAALPVFLFTLVLVHSIFGGGSTD